MSNTVLYLRYVIYDYVTAPGLLTMTGLGGVKMPLMLVNNFRSLIIASNEFTSEKRLNRSFTVFSGFFHGRLLTKFAVYYLLSFNR